MALCSAHYQDVVLGNNFAHTFRVRKGSALASRIEVICRRVIVELSQQSSDLWTKLGLEWFAVIQGNFQSKDLRIKCGAFILGQEHAVFSLQQVSSFGRIRANAPGACGFRHHSSQAQGQKHGHSTNEKSAHYQANSKYQ